jgi:hypothetical protein
MNKKLLSSWIKRVLKKTPEQVEQARFKKAQKRAGIFNPRTFVGQFFIGRNDPCYCGSERKFKHCCWSQHAILTDADSSPERLKAQQKTEAYFKKHRRLPR